MLTLFIIAMIYLFNLEYYTKIKICQIYLIGEMEIVKNETLLQNFTFKLM